eukprot:scaffold12131_cov71-Cyclotella_meneghiniana.AAC.16
MNAELLLSRTTYKAGTPVVGTVRICSAVNEDASESSTNDTSIRSKISTAHLYLTGQAHLRPGSSSWRSSKEISKLKSLYGEHACLTLASSQERKAGDEKITLIEQADRVALHLRMHNRNEFRSELPINESYYGEEDVICYWMTNVIDLMDVAEDAMGEELIFSEDSNPNEKEQNNNRSRYYLSRKPLKLPDYNTLCQLLNTTADLHDTFDEEINSLESPDDSDLCDDGKIATKVTDQSTTWERIMASAKSQPDDSSTLQQQKPLLKSQLAITFRSNLPDDVPPTITTECVKYFYSAVLVVTTTNNEVIIKGCPFSVLTRNSMTATTHQRSNRTSSTRVHIGELYAKAHSTSLPCELSSMEALEERKLHVISDPPSC